MQDNKRQWPQSMYMVTQLLGTETATTYDMLQCTKHRANTLQHHLTEFRDRRQDQNRELEDIQEARSIVTYWKWGGEGEKGMYGNAPVL